MKTKQELIDFETWTVNTFNDGKLKSPVHLSGGNENELIEIFKSIKPQDWVFTTYRSHYHALLKGVPEQRLKDWIMDNKSIHFMDSEYKIFSSAIVGGTLPIALGVAMAIKRKTKQIVELISNIKIEEVEIGKVERMNEPMIYCFIGDMTAHTGIFHECFKYAINHKLPIKFIVENNFLSTDTLTNEVWGITKEQLVAGFEKWKKDYPQWFDFYTYTRGYPHYGTGKFISSLWKDVIKENDPRNKGF
jgi:pyruvate dehydrogenase E1 component alpha subunit